MIGWLRYGWPRRRIIKLTGILWPHHNAPEWLLNFLYPGDCGVTFK
jgi:hypothetical protein